MVKHKQENNRNTRKHPVHILEVPAGHPQDLPHPILALGDGGHINGIKDRQEETDVLSPHIQSS